ncbi:protein of unknown function [Virgibacillus salinus]|uniref:DUF960 domain-containing protein n=2 Tax=Virgibacillus salinus TaxID=553311 RepID=A0A1H0XUN9_9BACI|nr:protein of unknown function [Virgibacillus salinus]
MTEKHKSRYMTKAINEELNVKLQMTLWQLMDILALKRKDKMDYLQVFDIIVSGSRLKIINKQEHPYMVEKFININGNTITKSITVWIIDDIDKQTMLFPSDY